MAMVLRCLASEWLGFVVSVWAAAWAWRVSGLEPAEKSLLVSLADVADDADRVSVSESWLRGVTGLSASGLRSGVLKLVAAGCLERVQWLATDRDPVRLLGVLRAPERVVSGVSSVSVEVSR